MKTAAQLADSVLLTCPWQSHAADACRVLAKLARRVGDHAYEATCCEAERIIDEMSPDDWRLSRDKLKVKGPCKGR